MFGLAALVCFIVGYIFHGAATVTSFWFDPTAMMLAGLAFGTLHLMGYGTTWPPRR